MAFRRFRKRFQHMTEAGKVTYPAGWAGELPEEVAKAADAGRATYVDKTQVVAASSAPSDPLDQMTKDELVGEAKKRGVTIKADDTKAEILAALKAAEQPVT